VDERLGFSKKLAECFTDYRDEKGIEHEVEALVRQRIYGIALGYEDLNDHDDLRSDPLLAVLCGKEEPMGSNRKNPRDQGKALAGKSTLKRVELTEEDADEKDRYKKIKCDGERIRDQLLCARLWPLNIDSSKGTVQEPRKAPISYPSEVA